MRITWRDRLWRWLLGSDLAPRVPWERFSEKRLLLHVGCGAATRFSLPSGFHRDEWQEIRVDLDPAVSPDLLASITDLRGVPDAIAHAYYASHVLEHLYWFEVPVALAEAKRVLRSDGFAVITCPDLQAAAEWIAQDRLFAVAYESPAGPITPFDLVYSYRPFVERSPQTMSHKCGFTLSALIAAVQEAGFAGVYGMRRPAAFDLWILAQPSATSAETLHSLAASFLPPHREAVAYS